MKCIARFPHQSFSNPVFFSDLEPWADLQKKQIGYLNFSAWIPNTT